MQARRSCPARPGARSPERSSRRRPCLRPLPLQEEWEPGAYGLVDVPPKNGFVRGAAASPGRAGSSGRQAPPAAALPPRGMAPAPRTAAGRKGLGMGAWGAGGGRKPLLPATQPRSVSPSAAGFPFVGLQPVNGTAPPVLWIPRQLSQRRPGGAAAGGESAEDTMERLDSAAFGSELSFGGNDT